MAQLFMIPMENNPNTPQKARPQTIHQIVRNHAENQPDAIALAAPGRSMLSYASLYTHICHVVETLNLMDIGRNDRVAIVLPNGPEMAVTFLAVASAATSAPLNPAYRPSDYDFYLSDLNAKALITLSGFDTPAVDVAHDHSIPIIYIDPGLSADAGLFKLLGETTCSADLGGFAGPDDVALVLHTSGTTSRPKMVPLKHTNVCSSAQNIQKTLILTNEDRCLNVMPLFHIHGLMGAVLSSISAGASIVCTPGFRADRFFDWMGTFKPSWYSAVPTIHQAILGQASVNSEIIAANPLRFIRSSSASLPPQVMRELEVDFHAPVVESYGMTEASHQMTSNPLPPLQRKPGTVGLPAGPEVAIMDRDGKVLSQGATGEIVIRGPNVTQGYENNPDANKTAFSNGWFRTGDEGHFDSEGYLYISGRLKEIINRGGEKVTPREIDEAFLEHASVTQAVAFAVSHPTLGEDVAAAVVLEKDASVSEKELRDFAFTKLADFKVPTQVIIVEQIPKGATGKLQRLGLAKMLEAQLRPEYVAPRTDTQKFLATLMAEVLNLERVGIYDNFFTLGGDSLLAALFFSQITEQLGKKLPLATLFQAPTVEQLANVLEDESWSAAWSSLVAIQPNGSRPPFYFVHAHGGNVVGYYPLAHHLGSDQPFYGLQAQGLNEGDTHKHKIKEMAEHYIMEIQNLQPSGPYYLGGWCMGGGIAYEMAHQLVTNGDEVALLAMVQPTHKDYPKYQPDIKPVRRLLYQIIRRIDLEYSRLMETSGPKARLSHLWERFGAVLSPILLFMEKLFVSTQRRLGVSPRHSRAFRLKSIEGAHNMAYEEYEPIPYAGNAVIFYANKQPLGIYPDPTLGWGDLLQGDLTLEEIPGYRIGMLSEPRVRIVAQRLQKFITESIDKNDNGI